MRPSRSIPGAAALISACVALVLTCGPARADSESCREFRENIVRMEASSVRPPGWYKLDYYLRLQYGITCASQITDRPREKEWWHRSDGTNTGYPADGPRPDDGAYATTEEIGARCAGAAPSSSTCALLLGVEKSCRDPSVPYTHSKKVCDILFGKDRALDDDYVAPGSGDLPDLTVTVDGRAYTVPPSCIEVLRRLEDGASDSLRGDTTLQKNCPELLAALQRRTGKSPEDPSQFWPALRDLVQSGFAPPGTPSTGPASILNDPGYRRMCEQAERNMGICDQRERQYRGNLNEDADQFAQCRQQYARVVDMCRNTRLASLPAPRPGATAPPPQPAKATPPPKAAAPAKPPPQDKATPGQSRPPPKTQAAAPQPPAMSPQCQKLVGDYVAAARAKDGPRALAGYNALKRAGGCGVLQKVDRPLPKVKGPPPNDPRLLARGATPLTDDVVGRCDASPAECAARVRQLQQGTSPEAKAALTNHAIGVGLELGNAMSSGLLVARPPAVNQGRVAGPRGPNTDMNSLAGPIIRSRPAQGAPSGPVQRNTPSDIRMQ